MIKFDENLFTHIKGTDDQHSKLVELLNNTYKFLKESKKDETIKLFKNELIAYVEHHLSGQLPTTYNRWRLAGLS